MALTEPSLEAPAAQSGPETGTTLTVDLDMIADNWQSLTRRLFAVECGAVVKANAYGLGLEPVTARLVKAGCKTFFVADVAEGRRARSQAPEAAVYVLNGFSPEAAQAFVELDLRPAINSMVELAEWDAFVAAQGWRGGAALHVNTGMNRLGMPAEEAAALALRLQQVHHGISLLMSHLACAEVQNHPLNASQVRQFRELRMLFHGVPASLVNSSGIFLGDKAHFDLARPGAALYGINPTPGQSNPMRNVLTLSGRILQVRKVPQGESVGYGAAWKAKRPSRVAIASGGYADGLFRAGSGVDRKPGGSAIVAKRRCPIIGYISMDLICIDVTDLPDNAVRRGEKAIFIGDNLPVDEVATAAGTIGYEVLVRLGSRSHLAYRSS